MLILTATRLPASPLLFHGLSTESHSYAVMPVFCAETLLSRGARLPRFVQASHATQQHHCQHHFPHTMVYGSRRRFRASFPVSSSLAAGSLVQISRLPFSL
jgi:hypothetical protein